MSRAACCSRGVQRLYNADWDREWLPEEERKSTLVFIGVDLPEEEIRGRIGGWGKRGLDMGACGWAPLWAYGVNGMEGVALAVVWFLLVVRQIQRRTHVQRELTRLLFVVGEQLRGEMILLPRRKYVALIRNALIGAISRSGSKNLNARLCASSNR